MNELINQTDEQIEQTRAIYKSLPSALTSCDCLYCQNYIACIPSFPEWIQKLTDHYGLDLTKAAEIMALDSKNDLRQFFAIYHVIGSASPVKYEQQDATVFIETEEFDFVPDIFPEPIAQVMIELWLPWVVEPLDEQG